jgi:hypothetical protein
MVGLMEGLRKTIAYFRLLAEPAPSIGVLDAVAAE